MGSKAGVLKTECWTGKHISISGKSIPYFFILVLCSYSFRVDHIVVPLRIDMDQRTSYMTVESLSEEPFDIIGNKL